MFTNCCFQSNRTPKEIQNIENCQLSVDVATNKAQGKTCFSLSKKKWECLQGFAAPMHSCADLELLILDNKNNLGTWKYFYEDFKQYKAEIAEEIQNSSISKWSDHQLKQCPQGGEFFYAIPHKYYSTYSGGSYAIKPRLVELLEKDKIIMAADSNFQF